MLCGGERCWCPAKKEGARRATGRMGYRNLIFRNWGRGDRGKGAITQLLSPGFQLIEAAGWLYTVRYAFAAGPTRRPDDCRELCRGVERICHGGDSGTPGTYAMAGVAGVSASAGGLESDCGGARALRGGLFCRQDSRVRRDLECAAHIY